jgi:hypothetical protein
MPLNPAPFRRWWPAIPPLVTAIHLFSPRFTPYRLSFDWWVLNSAYMALVGVLLPISLWVLIGWIRLAWIRTLLRTLLVLALPPYAVALASPIVRGASWEVVAEVARDGATYRAYKRPFYLYDSAIELRREIRLVPGLKMVEGPRRAPEADRADLRVLENGRVEAKIHNYHGKEWSYTFAR